MKSIQLSKKKGMSIGDMYPAVLTIILVGIILGVGLFVLGTFHDQITPDRAGTQTLVNGSTGTTTLTDAALTNFNVSVLTAINATAPGTAVTNFTYTGAGVVTWGTNLVTGAETDLYNLTYTYTYDAANTAETAVSTVSTGLATFADWIAIIVVVIAAAIVLGVVLTSFGRKRNLI